VVDFDIREKFPISCNGRALNGIIALPGEIWLAMQSSILVLDKTTKEMKTIHTLQNYDYIASVAHDKRRNLMWLGTTRGEIKIFHLESQEQIHSSSAHSDICDTILIVPTEDKVWTMSSGSKDLTIREVNMSIFEGESK